MSTPNGDKSFVDRNYPYAPITVGPGVKFRFNPIKTAIGERVVTLLPSDFPIIRGRSGSQVPKLFQSKSQLIDPTRTVVDWSLAAQSFINSLSKPQTVSLEHVSVNTENFDIWWKYLVSQAQSHIRFWKNIENNGVLDTPCEYLKFQNGKIQHIWIHFAKIILKSEGCIFEINPHVLVNIHYGDTLFISLIAGFHLFWMDQAPEIEKESTKCFANPEFFNEIARKLSINFPEAAIVQNSLLPNFWDFTIYALEDLPQYLKRATEMIATVVENFATEIHAWTGHVIHIPVKPINQIQKK